jgi:hypothetical protein
VQELCYELDGGFPNPRVGQLVHNRRKACDERKDAKARHPEHSRNDYSLNEGEARADDIGTE